MDSALHGLRRCRHGGKMDKEHGRSGLNAEVTEGALVLKEVGNLTGLPEDYLDAEITEFLGTTHDSVNDLTLDQLRSVLLNYLETVNEEMNEGLDKH